MPRAIQHTYIRIWDAVCRIPCSKVSTYGNIARLSGLPRQARLVGYALHNLPPGADIPWHRVVNWRGEISLSGDSARTQRALLEEEGIAFQGDRIDLGRYGWPPRSLRKATSRR